MAPSTPKNHVNQKELDALLGTPESETPDTQESKDPNVLSRIIRERYSDREKRRPSADDVVSNGGKIENPPVSQDELDELMDSADTMSMSKAEIISHFGKGSLRPSKKADEMYPELINVFSREDFTFATRENLLKALDRRSVSGVSP